MSNRVNFDAGVRQANDLKIKPALLVRYWAKYTLNSHLDRWLSFVCLFSVHLFRCFGALE